MVLKFEYTNSMATCDTEIEIHAYDGTNWIAPPFTTSPLSKINFEINSQATGPWKVLGTSRTPGTFEDQIIFKIWTSDFTIDDGTLPPPDLIKFRFRISSPNYAERPTPADPDNPVNVNLDFTIYHPCRDATITQTSVAIPNIERTLD